jgi:hypothetical protein
MNNDISELVGVQLKMRSSCSRSKTAFFLASAPALNSYAQMVCRVLHGRVLPRRRSRALRPGLQARRHMLPLSTTENDNEAAKRHFRPLPRSQRPSIPAHHCRYPPPDLRQRRTCPCMSVWVRSAAIDDDEVAAIIR